MRHEATGPAVLLLESGKTVVHAFIVSGIFALSAITLLLLIALRRIGDVLLTLVPLLVAGVVTLELCVVVDLPLNFANIIALPLLLGVGVAFKIYYFMAWRSGKTGLLQSSLTRAVVFSAMTTATAFGSLWLSSNPGTSSMGKLMALALICTMVAAVFFQPLLMGPPRQRTQPQTKGDGEVPLKVDNWLRYLRRRQRRKRPPLLLCSCISRRYFLPCSSTCAFTASSACPLA
jgi:predicted RND superfamily exporter protein